jgi:hypothetical protein
MFIKAENNNLTIPKIILNKEAGFEESINNYLQSLNLDYKVRGIVKVNLGNNGTNNFYKITYFV